MLSSHELSAAATETPVFPVSQNVTAQFTNEYGTQLGEWINYYSIILNGTVSRYAKQLLITRYPIQGKINFVDRGLGSRSDLLLSTAGSDVKFLQRATLLAY